jgi:hypothetical protein
MRKRGVYRTPQGLIAARQRAFCELVVSFRPKYGPTNSCHCLGKCAGPRQGRSFLVLAHGRGYAPTGGVDIAKI